PATSRHTKVVAFYGMAAALFQPAPQSTLTVFETTVIHRPFSNHLPGRVERPSHHVFLVFRAAMGAGRGHAGDPHVLERLLVETVEEIPVSVEHLGDDSSTERAGRGQHLSA